MRLLSGRQRNPAVATGFARERGSVYLLKQATTLNKPRERHPFVARDAALTWRYIQCCCTFPKILKIGALKREGCVRARRGSRRRRAWPATGEQPCVQSSSDQGEGRCPGGGLTVMAAGGTLTNASTADSAGSARRGLHSSRADSCSSALLWLHCKLQSTAAPALASAPAAALGDTIGA